MPPSVVLCKGPRLEPTQVDICQDRRVQDADAPERGWQGLQRRRVHVRDLSRLLVLRLQETLPDEMQDVPHRPIYTAAGSAVSERWRSVRTTYCRAAPGTARLALVQRRGCSRAATVGAALLPPWRCTRAVTRWTASWAVRLSAAARWASWTMQLTGATHRRAPSCEGCFHPLGCRPGMICAMFQSRILSPDLPW